jgi:tryptophan-rich sensory protein
MLPWLGQLALNATSSRLFFGGTVRSSRSMRSKYFVIAIALTAVSFQRFDGRAAALLVPYRIWVIFSYGQNSSFWRLNT